MQHVEIQFVQHVCSLNFDVWKFGVWHVCHVRHTRIFFRPLIFPNNPFDRTYKLSDMEQMDID
jgi:hypothetical protein